MGKFVATEIIKLMMRKDIKVLDAKVLILGFTFKENCPDVRNTRVIDIYHELRTFDMAVDVYDPWASAEEVQEEYGISIHTGKVLPSISSYAAVVLAVSHDEFAALPLKKNSQQVIYDVKGFLDRDLVDARL
jgi:UDP-N-acetyl-D-galactosamine dehydrogenase